MRYKAGKTTIKTDTHNHILYSTLLFLGVGILLGLTAVAVKMEYVVGGIILALVVLLTYKKPAIVLAVYLLVALFSEYVSTQVELRLVRETSMSIWTYRPFLGLSLADIGLLSLTLIQVSKVLITRKWLASSLDKNLVWFGILVLLASVNGAVTHRPVDNWRDWLFDNKMFLYFIAIYFLVSRSIRTERQIEYWVGGTFLAIGLQFIYSTTKAFILLGSGVRLFSAFGLPFLMTDTTTAFIYIFFVLGSITVKALKNRRVVSRLGRAVSMPLSLAMLAVFIASARRLSTVYAIIGIGLLFPFLKSKAKTWFMVLVISATVGVAVCILLASDTGQAPKVLRAFDALLDFSPKTSLSMSTRYYYTKNLIANFVKNPHYVFVGAGLGKKWEVISFQPVDPLVHTESIGYTKVQPNWLSAHPVPYSLFLFKFGLCLSSCLFLTLFLIVWKSFNLFRHSSLLLFPVLPALITFLFTFYLVTILRVGAFNGMLLALVTRLADFHIVGRRESLPLSFEKHH